MRNVMLGEHVKYGEDSFDSISFEDFNEYQIILVMF